MSEEDLNSNFTELDKINLLSIMPIENLTDFKVHLAVSNNEGVEPLDSFITDWKKWKGWNSFRRKKDRFNRRFIFSLMHFYPQTGLWLFGGIFKVLERHTDWYDIELTDRYKEMIGRLKIQFPYTSRNREINLERYYSQMSVHEILPKVYDGEAFRGFENICLSFNELHNIIKKQRLDWKTALENVYGIYLIVDKSNGKKYVGSAYGGYGLWSRWSQYINDGHGGNTMLRKVMETKGLEYARKFYQFSLLEFMPSSTSDSIVVSRENYWKKVLLSRGDFGYNSN